MVANNFGGMHRNVSQILSKIPTNIWNRIVEEEPEWINMHGFLEKYRFGRFAVLMTVAG